MLTYHKLENSALYLLIGQESRPLSKNRYRFSITKRYDVFRIINELFIKLIISFGQCFLIYLSYPTRANLFSILKLHTY